MRDKNLMRTVMSIVLAFFLFAALSLATVAAEAGLTVFSSGHFTGSFEDSIYAEKNFDSLASALKEEAELHSMNMAVSERLSRQISGLQLKAERYLTSLRRNLLFR